VSYVARLVHLDPTEPAEGSRPVVARRLDFGTEDAP